MQHNTKMVPAELKPLLVARNRDFLEEWGRPPTAQPTFGDPRLQQDRQGEVRNIPPTAQPPAGDTLRSDYRDMSSEEAIVQVVQENRH